ncbi:MAG: hypothetical protein A3C36_02185 [Omnitrophica WOR_2 bacterium RIFCSPHIGHO2_02_FULL_52_10]|nr:MAG: hypothetical protein A3C36_02185 [Omnitrophica WOR_2 bacterium RIFCSPHIGHO2_02_FULL_52_10]
MFNGVQLIKILDDVLKNTGYVSDMEIAVPDVRAIYFVRKPLVLKVRNLCAFIDLPEVIMDRNTAKEYFEFIRKCLMQKYGDAFLWKELELCFIVFCEDESFKMLKEEGDKVVHKASFELNAMLGTFFINKSNYDVILQSTWGLHFSGQHLQAFKDLIFTWCNKQKEAIENNRPDI